MSRLRPCFLAAVLALVPLPASALDGVVASIKPIHSLVAGVMGDTGAPHLLVRGAGSPHTYALRPSDAAALESSSVVFWVGPEMETFLESAIDTLGSGARVVELGEAHDLIKLRFREGGAFEAHDQRDDDHHHDHEAGHDDHAHDHDDHAHEKAGHDHDHEEKEAAHDHDDHHHDDEAHADHGHGEFDMHVWLDPQNAAALVHEIAEALSEVDPENAAAYEANAAALRDRIGELTTELTAELEPVKDKPFVVFHDAYRYFETRFGLKAAGSITVNPDVMPGAERMREIQTRVHELGATCVFSEPQFEPKLVTVATEGTGAGSGVLDPLGAALDDGPELYFELLRGMASSLKDCLSQAG